MRRFCIVCFCMVALSQAACDSTAPTSTQPPAGSDLDAGNLLRDPGFEDDATAWERILGPQLGRFVATERVHSGEHSLAIQASSETEAVVFQKVPVEGGAVYDAAGWVLTESAGGGGASIVLQWIDDRSAVVKEETIDVLFWDQFLDRDGADHPRPAERDHVCVLCFSCRLTRMDSAARGLTIYRSSMPVRHW